MNYGEFIPLIECEINRSRVGDFYNKNSTVYDCDTGEVTDFLQLFDKGESNKVFCSKTLKHRPSITILGDSNFVFIGKGCKLANLKIKINSSNNFVFWLWSGHAGYPNAGRIPRYFSAIKSSGVS